jgi:hypothetical protein
MPAGPAGEDRSQWRYEEGGEPYVVAIAFGQWAAGDVGSVEDGAHLTTSVSWPIWRDSAVSGALKDFVREVTHYSTMVRYPADGMAYVIAPITHPDHTESFLIMEPAQIHANTFTLLLEDGTWRVHQVGQPLSPAEVGKDAYSW